MKKTCNPNYVKKHNIGLSHAYLALKKQNERLSEFRPVLDGEIQKYLVVHGGMKEVHAIYPNALVFQR